jgi:DNA-directed RNA polymerase I, II, and III subunit RPABC5
MLIPIRCYTCNKVLADKWMAYATELQRRRFNQRLESDGSDQEDVGDLLDQLGLVRYCCRAHFMGHVDPFLIPARPSSS